MSWRGPFADCEAAIRLSISEELDPSHIVEGPVFRPQSIGRDTKGWAWVLVEAKDNDLLIVCVLAARFDDGKWYGNVIPETMGPCVFDPPLGWLQRSPVRVVGYSASWRECVLAGVEAAWEVQHGRIVSA